MILVLWYDGLMSPKLYTLHANDLEPYKDVKGKMLGGGDKLGPDLSGRIAHLAHMLGEEPSYGTIPTLQECIEDASSITGNVEKMATSLRKEFDKVPAPWANRKYETGQPIDDVWIVGWLA